MNGKKNRINQEYDMEKEPKSPRFMLEIGNHRLICTPDNTNAYLYEDPTYDHIFYITNKDEDGVLGGYHIWRPMLGNEFDEVVKYMINSGYEVESLTEPDDNDKGAFFQRYPNEPQEPIKLLEPKELTPRVERRVAFLGYLLMNDLITQEEWEREGDIVI